MKAFVTLCGMGVVALAMTACNQAPPAAPDTHDADVKAIQDVETQSLQSWAAKDADKAAMFYADDAVVIAPGMEPMQGKDAIHTSLKQMMADPAISLTFQSSKVEVAKSGELGYSEGSYKMTMTDPVTHKVVNDHGGYVTTFRKQVDGSWKAEADIASSSVPPPAPKKH